jgi:DNA-binding winged helix-turn-helix (wHTH) protein/Tfp pilus assembly protein PilF
MAGGNVFRFAEFTLDSTERQLLRNGAAIPLAPKAFDLLVALVCDAGRLVTKDQLLARVWPDVAVEEGIISVQISALRKALGGGASCIETVPRAGYRFVAPVTTLSSANLTMIGGTARPVEVYELVGRGRANLLSGSSLLLPAAVESFRTAIDIDPEYAPAHAGLALARCARASVRATPHRDEYAQAKVSALRALALDPNSADAQVALGTVLFLSEWAWADAERSFRRALDVNPAHTEGLLQYGSLLEALGKFDAGLHFKHRALERDSRSTLVLVQIAMSYWHQRRYEETRTWAQRALDVDPRHDLASECLSSVYWKLGDIDGLIEETARRAAASGAPEHAVVGIRRASEPMKRAYEQTGAAGLAHVLIRAMTARPQDAAHSAAVQLAVFCGAAGRLDDAFTYLDEAIASRDPALVHLGVAPQWDTLRHDQRFTERLQNMSLPST